MDFYPPADHTSEWFGNTYPGVDMGGVDKVLWHSTEGAGWSPYDGGAKAPTLTYFPAMRAWRQHFRLTQSARALQDPTSTPVRENRDRIVQVEIVGTCDPRLHASNPGLTYVPDLTDDQLNDLAEFAAFMNMNFGVPFITAHSLPYPQSSGNSPVRMTSSQFDSFKGFLQHQNASGNDHGDAGALAAITITERAMHLVAEATGKDWLTMATPADVGAAVLQVLTDDSKDVVPPGEYRKPLLVHQSLAGLVLAGARAAVDAQTVATAAANRATAIGVAVGQLAEGTTALGAQVAALSTQLTALAADVAAANARLAEMAPAAGKAAEQPGAQQ